MFKLEGQYTDAIVYSDLVEQEAISQIMGMCNHPAFKGAKIRIMPDVHPGAGCTIGTTIHMKERKIVPNLVGVDIGCGVLTTIFKSKEQPDFFALEQFILEKIPHGHDNQLHNHPELKRDVKMAIKELVKDLNFGNPEQYYKMCGSLGGGNHYIEVGQLDEETYALSVHTGSRNLGKKVCEYFQRKAVFNIKGGDQLAQAERELIANLKKNHREKEISKELINLRNNSDFKIQKIPKSMEYVEGEMYDAYVKNMMICQRFAAENRRLITHDILSFLQLTAIEQFDTIHNYIEQESDGSIIIRKGAIAAHKGQKVAIPLNMKDGVIIGIGLGNEEWNNSAPHGAGRLFSRARADAELSIDEFKEDMKDVQTWSVCAETLDESPRAYKPAAVIIEQVQDTIQIENIIKPVYNFKAHSPKKDWKTIKKEIKEYNRKQRELYGQ